MSYITQHLRARAAATGETRHVNLKGGARLAVRIHALTSGQQVILTIGRRGAKVGTTEEVTFKRDCLVPAHATRYPADPAAQATKQLDGEIWHLVGYSWNEEFDI